MQFLGSLCNKGLDGCLVRSRQACVSKVPSHLLIGRSNVFPLFDCWSPTEFLSTTTELYEAITLTKVNCSKIRQSSSLGFLLATGQTFLGTVLGIVCHVCIDRREECSSFCCCCLTKTGSIFMNVLFIINCLGSNK